MQKDISLYIKDLKKIYNLGQENEKIALNGASLEVPRGSIFSLLGPNGAGKSTLINILAGLVVKTSGKVLISGIDIDEDMRYAKSKIGIVPQELVLDTFFPVYQSLEFYAGYYGIRPKDRKTKEIINALGLQDKVNATSRQLSGGMKRRLLVAKAMVHSPEILILDEPTAGVDIELREQLWNYVQKLNKQGTTVILTTHYLEEAQKLSDYIAFINNGKIIKSESKTNLLNELSARQAIITTIDPLYNILESKLSKYSPIIVDNHNLKIEYFENDNIMGQVLSELNNLNIRIKDIDISQGNLEDIFKKLIKKDNENLKSNE